MFNKHLRQVLITLTLVWAPVMVVADTPATPVETLDQLQLIKKTSRGELRMATGADWNRYGKIELQKATVTFRKNWARDQKRRNGNRPTEENMQRIKTDLSDLLDEVFRQELTRNGDFEMTETGGEDVMRITPKIVNLNIVAPDRMRDHIGSSFADSKGSMTLEFEVYDSLSGTLLARMTDRREDPQKGYMEWTVSGTNRRAARLMFVRWAKKLRSLLIEAGTPE